MYRGKQYTNRGYGMGAIFSYIKSLVTLKGSLPIVPNPSVNEHVSHGRDHVFTDNFQLVARMCYQGPVFAIVGREP